LISLFPPARPAAAFPGLYGAFAFKARPLKKRGARAFFHKMTFLETR